MYVRTTFTYLMNWKVEWTVDWNDGKVKLFCPSHAVTCILYSSLPQTRVYGAMGFLI